MGTITFNTAGLSSSGSPERMGEDSVYEQPQSQYTVKQENIHTENSITVGTEISNSDSDNTALINQAKQSLYQEPDQEGGEVHDFFTQGKGKSFMDYSTNTPERSDIADEYFNTNQEKRNKALQLFSYSWKLFKYTGKYTGYIIHKGIHNIFKKGAEFTTGSKEKAQERAIQFTGPISQPT